MILNGRGFFQKLGAPTSDHRPILLDTHLEKCNLKRPFRFEAMWTKDESSFGVVERAWASMWKVLKVLS